MKSIKILFLFFSGLFLYSCNSNSNNSAENKPNYMDSLLTELSAELFDNCMSFPTTILSPYQEIPNVPSTGSIKFDGEKKELNIQTSYYNTNSDVFIQNLSFETMLGTVSNLKVEKYKIENVELPQLKAEWKSKDGNNKADVSITPIIIDNNGSGMKNYIEYYVGTSHWRVMGYRKVEESEFLKVVQNMCNLSGIDINGISPLISSSEISKNDVNENSNNVSNENGAENVNKESFTIEDPDGYTNVRKSKSSSSEILFQLNEGDLFAVTDKSGDWWKIDFNGKTGYVHSSRIKALD